MSNSSSSIDWRGLLHVMIAVAITITILLAVQTPSPRVVVNMPADAKPLAVLEAHDKVIGSDRAVLWWTVYQASISGNSSLLRDSAARNADQAVMTVYGPAPSK